MMRETLLLSLLAVTGCATTQPQVATGWTADPTYHAPTTVQVFLYGPASDVDAVIAEGRPLGWTLVERSVLASGSALALVEGPAALKPGAYIDQIVGNRRITMGPALRPEDRRLRQPR